VARRTAGTRSRKKPSYRWDGLQWPSTGVPVSPSQTLLILIDETTIQDRGGTLERIRGHITVGNWGGAAEAGKVQWAAKILLVEMNDAGAMTGDHRAIDTDQDDIAVRQLWTYNVLLPASATDTAENEGFVVVEVDVKIRIRLPPSGKSALIFLSSADVVNRAVIAGYLRCLIRQT